MASIAASSSLRPAFERPLRRCVAPSAGQPDLVAFGVPFLGEPGLAERWRRGASLNAPRVDHFYAGEEKGYTDRPTLEEVTA
jgi:N-ethylmaleimide reductase